MSTACRQYLQSNLQSDSAQRASQDSPHLDPKKPAEQWQNDTMLQTTVSDSLADLMGALAIHERSGTGMVAGEQWKVLLMALVVGIKVKSQSTGVCEIPPKRVLLLWRMMLKSLQPADSQMLSRLVLEDSILTRTSNLQKNIERVFALMELDQNGEVTYPNAFFERLKRAYVQHALEISIPGGQKQQVQNRKGTD
eukprot:TRINITY_DN21522_c0_g1_i1.p1 TRINITY_DN21522_c0_g1~~TRINITY_DN21522_c0_g1_i1.p1  ORF type:complete len:195 (-),score=35.63 TRINITY_DN21522_c0_g1_i1:195-779(-)